MKPVNLMLSNLSISSGPIDTFLREIVGKLWRYDGILSVQSLGEEEVINGLRIDRTWDRANYYLIRRKLLQGPANIAIINGQAYESLDDEIGFRTEPFPDGSKMLSWEAVL